MGLHEAARIAVDENGLGSCVLGQLLYDPDISQSKSSFQAGPFQSFLARYLGLRSLVFAPLMVEGNVFWSR